MTMAAPALVDAVTNRALLDAGRSPLSPNQVADVLRGLADPRVLPALLAESERRGDMGEALRAFARWLEDR